MRGKVLPYMPAFQPYRGKPAVRNDREGRGNVGIIRSPVRASTLPDCGGRPVMGVPTATDASSSPFSAVRRQSGRERRVGRSRALGLGQGAEAALSQRDGSLSRVVVQNWR